MICLVIFKQMAGRVPRKQMVKLFKNIMKEEADSCRRGQINLILTTDRLIRRINEQFRSKKRPTDVLSFNYGKAPMKHGVWGEIYISLEAARRQAPAYNYTVDEELLHLFCHGLLHLLGFDHIKRSDKVKMEARERYYLESLN